MNPTEIHYLTHTWSPIAMRCTPVSEGCAHCWHLPMARRFTGNDSFARDVQRAYAGGPPVLREDKLGAPLRRKKPAVVGVQFMGDLFHDDIPFAWIDRVIEVAALAATTRDHRFLFLTKRINRAMTYGNSRMHPFNRDGLFIGTTIENQDRADERLPDLLAIPGRHWVSVEPMLGPVDLNLCSAGEWPAWCEACEANIHPDNIPFEETCPHCYEGAVPSQYRNEIDWVVIGCESGPRRRPTKIEWVRDLVEQCRAAEVPVFVKQLEVGGRVVSNPDGWPQELPW